MRHVTHDKDNKRFSLYLFVSLSIYLLWIHNSGGLRVNLFFIVLDLALFILIFLSFLFVFSQFFFPITNFESRLLSFKRLLLYIICQHGPVSIVKDGSISHINRNLRRNNPGLILLDSASAAMLRNEQGLNRVVGPGIVFTEKKEIAVSSADLHVQRRWLGPLVNENPFSMKRKTKNSATYQEKSSRADQTRGFTREGIVIIPSFSFSFKLISSSGDGGTSFGFNPISVERALIDQPVEMRNAEKETTVLDWYELPGLLLVEVWRETLEKFSLAELFQKESALLKLIIEHMRDRLTKSEINEIGTSGVLTDKKTVSDEFHLLQKRGICFLELHLQQLWFPQEIEAFFTQRINSDDFRADDHLIQSYMEKENNSSEEEKFKQIISQIISNTTNFTDISPRKLREKIMRHYPEYFK